MNVITTVQQARAIADEHLNASSPPVDIIDAVTQEHEFGWVFFYDSRRYLETGKFSERLAGNAPVLVERQSGRVWVLGTARSVDFYLTKFRRYGDPHAQPARTVSLLGWRRGANAVQAIAVLRKFTGLSLSQAKSKVEARLNGEPVQVTAPNPEEADELAKELEACGFSAQQDHDRIASG
jgi:hypothetical protein